MKDKYKTLAEKALKTILQHLGADTSEALEAFTYQFFAKLPYADLKDLDPTHACNVARNAFQFVQNYAGGEPKIQIFTGKEAVAASKPNRAIIQIINQDMPFLVDSIAAELLRQGIAVHTLFHPIFRVKRDKSGRWSGLETSKSGASESLMHIETSALPQHITSEKLIADLQQVLRTVRFAVEDWQPIIAKLAKAKNELRTAPPGFKREESAEVLAFLEWLEERNFIFLGYLEYDFVDAKGQPKLSIIRDSELGIFKADDFDLIPKAMQAIPPEFLHFAMVPQLVEITKSNRKSVVHRAAHMDYIGVKRFDHSGKVIGERRFLGLFTSIVYYQSADYIPIIRRKIAQTLERSGFESGSHDGKALKAILEFLPRDELFQINEEELFESSMGILSLESRPSVGLFTRKDVFERFVSCMVFIPRERFSTDLREHIQRILENAFQGTLTAFYTQVTDSPLARLQLILKTTPGQIPSVDNSAVEKLIAKVTNAWSDALLEEITKRHGEAQAEQLFHSFGDAFPNNYINQHDVSSAVHDIEKINQAVASQQLSLEFFSKKQDTAQDLHLKIYNPGSAIALSDILPMLEHFGFRVLDENPYEIRPKVAGHERVWIRDFRLNLPQADLNDATAIKPVLEEALAQVWAGNMEDDALNALATRACMSWRNITLLRAYSRYLKQAGFTYGQNAIAAALVNHAHITTLLVALFHARFDPAARNNKAAPSAVEKETQLITAIETALAEVTNLAEDRILRRFLDVIRATLRTNFYQCSAEGEYKPVIAFKFDSAAVPELPLPRPYAEIFVYGVRVEGIHLRGGKVARGGLRWSDRHDDFRTEVLGLMKAQMVKNSVIVPVGSKGGFVVKRPPSEREAYQKEGVACYQMYLRGLLDVTDNIVRGEVAPPADVVRHDGDDPYLVVAADKGTATFSDIANGISAEYEFWLGDAFASGGSAGYDHKKMAITARGGWISVVRHFQEMGVDIATQPFTAVGIGDMSGDVFGNGMLLSNTMRLVAAFNHVHIFIDPTPDAKTSFAERQRLFALPRSSWKDYDAALISKGGGVFERSAKSIAVSAEARAALGIADDKHPLTPDELIRAILMAPVDVLWNGGIGTYVKASSETHDQVGDRTNNAVRINGAELRCKLVGEGGNLGFTQLGRREYALQGGRINTDAIDNSAGVDCSDHEVNIKIAFGAAIAKGTLSVEKRNTILATMTDEVAELVLKDNRLQTQAITIAEQQGFRLLDAQTRLMHALEKRGLLNRAVEFLPSDKMLSDMRMEKKGLTRPEIAVLLAYSKLALYEDLLHSTLPDNPYFTVDLLRYFPAPMREQFTDEITSHRLRREIIATFVTNSIVNRVGITFFQGIAEDTGMGAADIAAAYSAVRDIFDLRPLWSAIENDNPTMAIATRVEMFVEVNYFVERMTRWLLSNCPLPMDLETLIPLYRDGAEIVYQQFDATISDAMRKATSKRLEYFSEKGVSSALAEKIARLEAMASACDITLVARETQLPIPVVGRVYFEIGAKLQLGWLRRAASRLGYNTHWERLAIRSVVDDLFEQQRRLTLDVVPNLCDGEDCSQSVERWLSEHNEEIERYHRFIVDLKSGSGDPDLSSLVVAARSVKSLCRV